MAGIAHLRSEEFNADATIAINLTVTEIGFLRAPPSA
jgi:hypothetical protein